MTSKLETTAKALVAAGKGILAADESMPTIDKRFKPLGIANVEANRQAYRQMLFGTPGFAEHISGVILFDETIRQKSDDGLPFAEYLAKHGVIPGIKVDDGAKPLPHAPGEKISEGLDGLAQRLTEYRGMGARFAKWRAVITIGDGIPSRLCLRANAEALARYAALCQEAEIVPIVEPEVLMDGPHTIERCYEVTSAALEHVFAALHEHRIVLEGMLLKPNMVLSGTECAAQASIAQVAEQTITLFKRQVPAAVPGIVFLSGGQSDELATAHLNAMNQLGPLPWELSFSYGRALQAPSIKAWGGQAANVAAGQSAFQHRARCNGAARQGKYNAAMESQR
jgi:fructose-bisphosphate aldolase, class I